MDDATILEQLSNAFGPPGFEEEVRDLIAETVRPVVDHLEFDPLGNLIAWRYGDGEATLMLDAHTDEVGFMISHIDSRGFMRLAPLGGWDARILASHAVTIKTRDGTRYRGVIGSTPPHILGNEERSQAHKLEDLFVDVGARSADEVKEWGIRVGDPAVISYPFERAAAETVIGKAFDDRAGCAVAIRVLQELADTTLPVTLAVNFATSEEVGLRGAQTAAYRIAPTWALALEGTVAADVPGVAEAKQPTALGAGPAISVADKSVIVPRSIVQTLEELAEEASISYQYKTPSYGKTDAGAIAQSRGGVPSGVLSVPCRYIHAPLSVMRLEDFAQSVRLATAFVEHGPQGGRLQA
jgi:endoglucanase